MPVASALRWYFGMLYNSKTNFVNTIVSFLMTLSLKSSTLRDTCNIQTFMQKVADSYQVMIETLRQLTYNI